MRTIVWIIAAFTLLIGQAALAQGPSLGEPPPSASAEMVGTDGKTYTLDAVKGEKGLLVLFTCNHCPWVKAWDSRIAALGNAYSAKGVGVIAVNSNDPAAFPDDDMAGMTQRVGELGLTYPYVVDATSDVARAFGATKTPEAYLFDASGALVYRGTIDNNAEDATAVDKHYLKDALDAVVAGKPVPVAETKAMGCGIKFRAK